MRSYVASLEKKDLNINYPLIVVTAKALSLNKDIDLLSIFLISPRGISIKVSPKKIFFELNFE